MPASIDQFKTSLSLWASGVSVITYGSSHQKGGVTVSSFSSVSLEPPLVLFCLAKHSKAKEAIESAGNFAVNILSSEQKQISADFASGSLDKAVVLEGLNPGKLSTGAPILNGCLASLDCLVHQILDAGDHWIFLGQVEAVVTKEGSPLLYFNRNYRELV
ncbi:Flavin reductase related protein [Leptospira biflexa serovar Patoc strain 'Patoc 1 (Ames)']|uniref:Putative flavin reductase like protein n=1 Tax=Leptospira biflexa serovar Patoc (strain Patoc 1 / ATCC 23582 / Paris) TaxID=456481 RepID=B0ST15_LEPBP|nr:flavin reductase family protein [Leptospira biflexa]ABZ94593.1 Flavin reductase related protein [Leptospira biflexa serovar Patoc strain 'Patoc 1 (Ames)']ABZ98255.1 Putative flavin reductase like protein [Leptospira biflexa serovar Patoc strain 'Patoc 1 (Paris)']TGM31596.1 flavin reductase [Leptospira biflexa]TGM39244.1 flavin reductase [Leptospira biflexa]